ncbi:acyltransferase family protein [Qipengyuania sp. NPDC077563]|uniref:acyltransferase family protein n=1 Tax=Qipengyuania sp. NPDC077563 TaxID=3364497 RepID=UPI00384E6F16
MLIRAASGTSARIEGLRAIAIIAVVGYHLGLPQLSGGFIGVDVFFVISGYLISSSLKREKEQAGRITLGRFWSRRVSRLVPHGILMILTVIILLRFLPVGSTIIDALASAKAALLYVANLHFVSVENGYFGELVDQDPFLHMWSLGVEAQYYLICPLFFVFIPDRFRLQAIVVVVVTSAAISALLSPLQPVPSFYTLPTRIWEFGLGALVAYLPAAVWQRGAGWLGLLLILSAITCFSSETIFPGYAALIPASGAMLILMAIERDEMRMLGCRALVFLGPLSYGWYLWHWPLIVLARRISDHPAAIFVAATLSLLIAWIAYTFVEAPARLWLNQSIEPKIAIAAGIFVTAIVYFGLSI